MAGKKITLLSLINSAKDRANMEKSTLITSDQWKEYVNKSKDALYDLLISAYSDEYYVKTELFNLSSGVPAYSLPLDFYKLITCSLKSGDQYLKLDKFSYQSRNRNDYFPYRTSMFNVRYSYRISGEEIIIEPTPSSSDEIELVYIPVAVDLAADGDLLNGFNGFEEYIILDVAIKALRKEESDTAELERDLMRLIERLDRMADSRDIGSPAKITDLSKNRGHDIYE